MFRGHILRKNTAEGIPDGNLTSLHMFLNVDFLLILSPCGPVVGHDCRLLTSSNSVQVNSRQTGSSCSMSLPARQVVSVAPWGGLEMEPL